VNAHRSRDEDNDDMAAAVAGGGVRRWLVNMVIGALIAYFTAKGAIEVRVAVVEERENNHYAELQRSLERIERNLERLSQEQASAQPGRPSEPPPEPPSPRTPVLSPPGSKIH
jgi:hypothetical protein